MVVPQSSLSAVPEAPQIDGVGLSRHFKRTAQHLDVVALRPARDASARRPAPPAMKSITSRRALSLLLSGSSATASKNAVRGNMRRSNLNSMMYNLDSVQAVRLRLRSL